MRLLMVSEVAEILRVRRETVYQWIKDGELAAIHLGKIVRVSESDLADFIKTHRKGRNK